MQINIGFGINDEFCQHCACTMASILTNSDKNDDYKFFIVFDKLSEINKSKLTSLRKIRPFDIEFLHIEPSEYQDFARFSSMPASSFFRIKLFKLEEIDKILYIDSDTIVRKDLKEIYKINLSENYLAGAKDILHETLKKQYNLSKNSIYINAGVLLINTKKTREVDMLQKVSEFLALFKDSQYSDQDIINYSFQEKITEFDISYNFCFPYNCEYNKEYYYSIASDPSIIHFITNNKPWNPGSTCHKKSEYFKYLKLTPFYKDFIDEFKIDENVEILNKLNDIQNKLISFLGKK